MALTRENSNQSNLMWGYKGYKENVSDEQEREKFWKAICNSNCLSIVIHGLYMHWSYGRGMSFRAPRFANEEKTFLEQTNQCLESDLY
jgi:hypothetical protein